MSFLTEHDYQSQIRDYDLDDLTDYTDERRIESEFRAQADMESYLIDRYNVGQIFEQTGTNRNPLIIMYMIDIALYHLFCAIAPTQLPEVRVNRYNVALKWLEKVRKGELNPNLPANTDAQGKKLIDSVFGSNIPNRYDW